MTVHMAGTGFFSNNDGLVNEIFDEGGQVSFDIFDATLFAGGDELGKAYAKQLTTRWNSHAALVEALEDEAEWLGVIIENVKDRAVKAGATTRLLRVNAALKATQ